MELPIGGADGALFSPVHQPNERVDRGGALSSIGTTPIHRADQPPRDEIHDRSVGECQCLPSSDEVVT